VVTTVTDDILRGAHELLFGFNRYQDVNGAMRIYQERAKGRMDSTALNCLG